MALQRKRKLDDDLTTVETKLQLVEKAVEDAHTTAKSYLRNLLAPLKAEKLQLKDLKKKLIVKRKDVIQKELNHPFFSIIENNIGNREITKVCLSFLSEISYCETCCVLVPQVLGCLTCVMNTVREPQLCIVVRLHGGFVLSHHLAEEFEHIEDQTIVSEISRARLLTEEKQIYIDRVGKGSTNFKHLFKQKTIFPPNTELRIKAEPHKLSVIISISTEGFLKKINA